MNTFSEGRGFVKNTPRYHQWRTINDGLKMEVVNQRFPRAKQAKKTGSRTL